MRKTLKPIYILSGFLGSGKTTLLNRLLKKQAFKNTLVIINEFGEMALDHILIEESSDTILELSNGCLCCSIRGELVDTLLSLDASKFDRIIIETTGIADPLPIFQSLAFHPVLVQTYSPAEIIAVFDCVRGKELIEANEEANKQLAIADVIIPTKLDLIENKINSENEIRLYNQTALLIDNIEQLSPDTISQRTIKPETKPHGHRSHFSSLLLETEQLLDINILAGLLHHLSNTVGEDLLRIKGFACTKQYSDQPLLVQVSGQIVHDFELKEKWQTKHKTQLVVIVKNIVPQKVKTIFDAFINNIAIDTPDQKAMTENPLAIPGFEI